MDDKQKDSAASGRGLGVFSWLSSLFRPVWEQLKLVFGWILVSIWLYKSLWVLCPVSLIALSVCVLVNASAVFSVGFVLEWTLDQLQNGTDYSIFELAAPITGVVLLVWISMKFTQTLSIACDSYLQERFGTYFPKFVVQWGMRCFDGGTRYFEMLTRGKSAEYSLGFYVPQQFQLLNNLARWVMGIVIVITYIPNLWAWLLLACTVVLYLQVRSAVKFTQEDRRVWGLKAERTDIKKVFDYKLRFKGALCFGMSESLMKHIDKLSSQIFPRIRGWAWRLVWFELASILALGVVFFIANGQIMENALNDPETFTIGRIALLITTMSVVGYSLQMIVNVVAMQAKGADNMVDLVRYDNSKDSQAAKVVGTKTPTSEVPPTIEFKDLTFGYNSKYGSDELIVQDLNFSFKAGEVTYLLGRNGVGKTTGLNLLDRLYDPEPGQVLIDGVDVLEYEPQALRAYARHMSQTPLQIRLNFRQILALAAGYTNPEDCSEELMWQALEMACLADKVRSFRKGLDEPLGVWNKAEQDLSGGQWRLTNFAMFFMAYLNGVTRVLILDEPWVNIDPPFKASIEKTLFDLDATIVIVTHEIHRINEDDNVVFMWKPDGQGPTRNVVAGKHGELYNSIPDYKAYCNL